MNKNLDNNSILRYNQKKLDILKDHKLISQEIYDQVLSVLNANLEEIVLPAVENILEQYQGIVHSRIKNVFNQSLFEYQKIIIRLAQSMISNKLKNHLKSNEANNKLEAVNVVFQQINQELIDNFKQQKLVSVDEILLSSSLISSNQLDFLHAAAEHLSIRSLDRRFGDIAVKNNLAEASRVKEALELQNKIFKSTGENQLLGDILVKNNAINLSDCNKVLLIQNRLNESEWETVLQQIDNNTDFDKKASENFALIAIKEKIISKADVLAALKIQAQEKQEMAKSEDKLVTVRWIGDILTEEFGLSNADRQKIVGLQISQQQDKLAMELNLMLDFDDNKLKLFQELDQCFHLSFQENEANLYLEIKDVPSRLLNSEQMHDWLNYHGIVYGIDKEAINRITSKNLAINGQIIVAKGKVAVPPRLVPQFYFNTSDIDNNTLPKLYTVGQKLIDIKKLPAKNGISVKGKAIVLPLVNLSNFKIDESIKMENNSFIVNVRGFPVLDKDGNLFMSQQLIVNGGIINVSEILKYPCDIQVNGIIGKHIHLFCHNLQASSCLQCDIEAKKININDTTLNAKIKASENIDLNIVDNSQICGYKDIFIKGNVSESVIKAGINCTINSAKVIKSTIVAGSSLILNKCLIYEGTNLIIGDNPEILVCKNEIENIQLKINEHKKTITQLNEKAKSIALQIEKKYLAKLMEFINEINHCGLNDNLNGKYENLFDNQIMNEFVAVSKQIRINNIIIIKLREQIKTAEKHIKNLQKTNEVSLKAKNSLLSAGTTIQFPHSVRTLDVDYENYVFKEEMNPITKAYEFKEYRW